MDICYQAFDYHKVIIHASQECYNLINGDHYEKNDRIDAFNPDNGSQ